MNTEIEFCASVKFEPLEFVGSCCNQAIHPENAEHIKIGEIFHVAKDHFRFNCVHCAASFPLFIQFSAHIDCHLQEIYTNAIGTEAIDNCEYNDVKPFPLDCNEEMPNVSVIHANDNIKQPRKAHTPKKRKYKKKCLDFRLPAVPPKEREFECYLCRSSFGTAVNLKAHFRKIHIKKFVFREFRYRLCRCTICGEKFNDVCVLAKHRRRHKEQMNDMPYKCHLCTKAFIEQYELKRHLNQHVALRVFKCNQCDKSFTTQRHRDLHVERHTGERRAQCSECGVVVSDKHKLKIHMRMHTGESPFQCEFCKKRFRQSYNLVVHKRSHTGEYIHYCKICEKGFGMRRELRKHNFRVHGMEMVDKKISNPN